MYIREVYMKKEDVQKRMLQGKGRWKMNRKFEDVLKINVHKEEKKTGVIVICEFEVPYRMIQMWDGNQIVWVFVKYRKGFHTC